MERIVDIATDNLHLSADRGFLKVSCQGKVSGQVPLDDIAAVVVHAHGVTYSNNLLVALSERNAILVACGSNHRPQAWLAPISGHHAQGARMRAQWLAGKPLQKRLWQQIVKSKILMQAAALGGFEGQGEPLRLLADSVRSGDPDNVEAQAARRYWPQMMGADFRRDQDAPGVNSMLNYGYAILRAAAARSVIASGLHPSMGIAHANRGNDLALADDVMEPYRPLVDIAVKELATHGLEATVSPRVKRALARLMTLDLETAKGTAPVFASLQHLCISLARSFETAEAELELPAIPTPMHIADFRRSILEGE